MKHILIATHVLDFSGASIFAFYVAKMLQKNGFSVDVISLCSGDLQKEYMEYGIPVYICDTDLELHSKYLSTKIKNTDLLLAFTILTAAVVEKFRFLVPIIWYIHEGKNLDDYLESQYLQMVFRENYKIWCVSEYVQEFLFKSYGKRGDVLHNFVPDEKKYINKSNGEKKVFLILGTIIKRKGYEELFSAYIDLAKDEKEKCEIHIAGEAYNDEYSQKMLKIIEGHKNLYYHGVLKERDEIIELYNKSDVVVVPSYDESCSLVVLESMMMGKPVIVTQNVGAKYMVSEKSGWIYETGNVNQLLCLLQKIIDDQFDLREMGIYAREAYMKYATEEAYESFLIKKIKSEMRIPTYIWRIIHYPHHLVWKLYYTYNITPFKSREISRGSRVILYGAGKNGKKWWQKLKKRKFCKVVGWVDKYPVANTDVESLDKLLMIQFDYVLVSVLNRNVQEEIKKELMLLGILEHQIIFLNE